MITGLDVAPLALPTCVSKEGEVREERRGGQRGRKGYGEWKREGKRTRAGAGKIDSAREREKTDKTDPLDSLDDVVEAQQHTPKDTVLAIKVRRHVGRDEKLRSVGPRARVSLECEREGPDGSRTTNVRWVEGERLGFRV